MTHDANNLKVSRIIGGCAERLNASTSSPARRETTSAVYHVIAGSGISKVGEETLTWKTGDTFCIPSWYKYQHFANEGETVYFYRFDDTPMLTALGWYRTEQTDSGSLVSD